MSPATRHRRSQARAATARRTQRRHRVRLTKITEPDLPGDPNCIGVVVTAADYDAARQAQLNDDA